MYAYIIECSDGSYYTGWTNDLNRRITSHSEGSGAKYTRGRGPVKLVYWEFYPTKQQAQRREAEIKKWTRSRKEKQVKGFAILKGGRDMKKTMKDTIKEMEKLFNIPSPSGFTGKIEEYIEKFLKENSVPYEITNKSAIVATLRGKNDQEHRTLSAHLDTLGAMVKEVKSSGRIKFDPIGGYMMHSVEGEDCWIHTQDEKIYTGTILTTKPSVHIHGDAKKIERNVENMEIVIDEKVSSKEDVLKLGINVGDFIALDPRTKITKSGFIKSRHIDDKAGVAILLGTIKHLVSKKIIPEYTTHFFFSNYEEVGHGASARIPEKTKEFLAIDMGTPGDGQTSTEFDVTICAKDSTGPYDFSFRKKLIDLGNTHKIPYQVDIFPFYGSDASAALRSGNDFKAGLIGPGVFASHGYERTHQDAIENTLKLVLAYLVSE